MMHGNWQPSDIRVIVNGEVIGTVKSIQSNKSYGNEPFEVPTEEVDKSESTNT